MYVQQTDSTLFMLRKSKMSGDGKCPVYARLTIDGLIDEMSTGIEVAPGDWNSDLKKVTDRDPDHKSHNKRLRQIETDLERPVDLIQSNIMR